MIDSTDIPDSIRDEIRNVCSNAMLYNAGIGLTPSSYIIPADDEMLRKEITAFVANEFKEYNVCDSYTSIDDYVFVTFAGCDTDMKEQFISIRKAADYANAYKGVLGIDCIALATHASEAQYFLTYIREAAPEAICLFFVPENPSANENRFITKLLQNLKNVKRLPPCAVSLDDLIVSAVNNFEKYNIEVEDLSGRGLSQIEELISLLDIKTKKDTERLVRAAAMFADISSGEIPVLSLEAFDEMIRLYKEEIGG